MPCYTPLTGYRSKKINKATGKRPIVFKASEGITDMPVTLPCGRCIGCKLEKSRQWAIRCIHEASMYEKNCFVTLTYNKEHLPKDKSVNYMHPVEFMKALRHKFGEGIKSFGCAEYGEKFDRPHYHICLFNHDFDDKEIHEVKDGYTVYKSKTLEKLWGKGFVTIGELNFETAAYVARYVTKKITGKQEKEGHYEWTDKHGEIHTRLPEKGVCVSRNPGLGRTWLEKWKKDVYPNDIIVVKGKRMKPPKYYDYRHEKDTEIKLFNYVKEKILPESQEMDKVKRRRKNAVMDQLEKEPDQRLQVKELVHELKAKKLKRSYENDL